MFTRKQIIIYLFYPSTIALILTPPSTGFWREGPGREGPGREGPRRESPGQAQPTRTIVGLLVWLCLWLHLCTGIASAQGGVQTYTVAAGDTLGLVAERFGIPLEQLAEFNGIIDINLIAVGQVLQIPIGPGASGLDNAGLQTIPLGSVRAQPGETLGMLSTRLSLDLPILAALNNMSDTKRLFPTQPIFVPLANSPQQPLRLGSILEVQAPPPLVQGETGRLFVTTNRPISITAAWNGLPITFAPLPPSPVSPNEGDAGNNTDLLAASPLSKFALLPVPALLAPQRYSVVITYTTQSNYVASRSWSVEVLEGPYASAEINLPPETAELLAPEFVESEINRLWEVWSQNQTPLQWDNLFRRPLTEQFVTTSPFGTRRSYNGGPYSSYHSGQDFGAPIGTIVQAPAPGIVALAEPLNVRGNAILLDHGRGIYTGYWHLSEIQVAVGQPVNQGDTIGLVGTTGLSTGAHLHWELRVYGIGVNPMQFLEEPLLPQ